ncbi:unnamed protein product [Owenia fusiformis]|uniref:Uncharacterized protein n=1 Tax=Owenia fusiformis TaxID=6347 RepID=A0A8S4P417_OWEFU|nr:unnamed protein product [Owenia fusiformis]
MAEEDVVSTGKEDGADVLEKYIENMDSEDQKALAFTIIRSITCMLIKKGGKYAAKKFGQDSLISSGNVLGSLESIWQQGREKVGDTDADESSIVIARLTLLLADILRVGFDSYKAVQKRPPEERKSTDIVRCVIMEAERRGIKRLVKDGIKLGHSLLKKYVLIYTHEYINGTVKAGVNITTALAGLQVDIRMAKKDTKEGRLTKEEFQAQITKKSSQKVLKVVGTLIGELLSELLFGESFAAEVSMRLAFGQAGKAIGGTKKLRSASSKILTWSGVFE